MGLMQRPGIFLAIKVYYSAGPSGNQAQELPASAHVLRALLCIWEDRPYGACVSSAAGSGFSVQVYFIPPGRDLALTFSPAAQSTSRGCCSCLTGAVSLQV